MTRIPPIPFEVLSWLAPVLAPVEGLGTLRHRQTLLWGLDLETALQREEVWLGSRFRNHGEDTLHEARRLVYQQGGTKKLRGARGRKLVQRLPAIEPDWVPDLVRIFDRVGRRYLKWSGDQLVVRAGRLEEFHHLALEFPVSHLVRHAHAQMLVRGQADADRLLELRSWIGRIPTENRTLAGVAERGLYEGHLHLKGLTSAEEMWADHVLAGRPRAASDRDDELLGLALARVSRVILRLSVIGFLLYDRYRRGDRQDERYLGDLGVLCLERQIDDLDRICREPDGRAVRLGIWHLERSVTELVYEALVHCGRSRGWLGFGGEEMVEYLLVPNRVHHGHRFPTLLRHNRRLLTALAKRHWAIEWFHLKLHQVLLELPSGQRRMMPRADRKPRPEAPLRGFLPAFERYIDRVFLRYLVLQSYHHQLGTQHGSRMGLSRFRQYFSAPQRKPVDVDDRAHAFAVVAQLLDEPRLHMVEGRVEPSPGGVESIRPWLLGFERATRLPPSPGERNSQPNHELDRYSQNRRSCRRFDFGLVVHFVKKPERSLVGIASARRVGWPATLPRYHDNRERARKDAMDLFRFLSRPDPQVPFVVGIDSCNLELAAPPEVFAPAFSFLRRYPLPVREDASFPLLLANLIDRQNLRHLLGDRHLGMTFHIGEDFRHLLSGLRAIDEAVRFLEARPSDRLGHAIALGVDPRNWAELLAGQTMVPRQEWLDNLMWVRHFLGPGQELLQRLRIEDQIQQHAAKLYRRRFNGEKSLPSALDLYHAWLLRQMDPAYLERDQRTEKVRERKDGLAARGQFHEPIARSRAHARWRQTQREVFAAIEEQEPRDIAFNLQRDYLYDLEVRRAGDELISIELDDCWLSLCEEVQDRLQGQLHDQHLVVEVNPMSNCTVGPMVSLSDHHVFRLTRAEGRSPRLFTTVNTDDPGVFQTSLAHEFYLLGETLLEQGVDEGEVVRWLEELRVNGAGYTFVKHLAGTERWRRDRLLDDLERLYGRTSETAGRWLDRL